MCTNMSGCGCGCQAIVLNQVVGPQGPSGSSSSVLTSDYIVSGTHAAGVETVMISQLIESAKLLLTNDEDKLNIIAWFTGGTTSDITVFRLKQNTTAVVAGANTIASLSVNSKDYQLKFHIELTRISSTTFKVEGEISLYGGLTTNSTTFTGQAPVFTATAIVSPVVLTSDFYIFGTIQSTIASNNCNMKYLGIESKKVII